MKKCDVVMKGGITSGIVYPGAVCELAKEYQFANIGGTSAGAIAAALTAAAEYARKSGRGGGFARLASLPQWLAGTTSGGGSRLLSLFQPSDETAPLFALATAYVETPGSWRRKSAAMLRPLAAAFHRYGAIVLAAGALLVVPAAIAAFLAAEVSPMGAIAAAVVCLALATLTAAGFIVAAAIEAIVSLARVLPRHAFGLCSGMSATGDALTQWLADEIERTSGLDRPLTFGDLEAHSINLEMMTTNLTHGRPYRIPFETRTFYFTESEMLRLFPERVVRCMIDRAPAMPRPLMTRHGEMLHRFPAPGDLPVVVAARMSLSFPILVAAVPLWAIDYGKRESRHPERCWFSDGGITSNFPVHFFDKPLPRWPTFAFNLAERTDRYHDEEQTVYVPRTNRSGIREWWSEVDSLKEFGISIVTTMQNWRDNMLLRLPGQRDRIAHVLLAPDEGGLNLTMTAETIERVTARGAEAARELRRRFGGQPPAGVTLTWSNHKWVRFLAFMPALEEALNDWAAAFPDRTEPPSFDDLLSGAVPLPSYKVPSAQRAAMHRASLAFLKHIHANFGSFRPARRPRPEPELRAMPRE